MHNACEFRAPAATRMGSGREGGRATIEAFTELKTVMPNPDA
jgi:acyl-CoA reductase-like NAD-dependent aldehyde dehydrogenase